jgi:hypothetical protein
MWINESEKNRVNGQTEIKIIWKRKRLNKWENAKIIKNRKWELDRGKARKRDIRDRN